MKHRASIVATSEISAGARSKVGHRVFDFHPDGIAFLPGRMRMISLFGTECTGLIGTYLNIPRERPALWVGRQEGFVCADRI